MATEANNKVILFNPYSAKYGYRIPNSILQVAASIDSKYEYVIIDGNLEPDPWLKIKELLDSGNFKYFGSTVMPGPQLRQAIPFTLKIRTLYPNVINIWGGYFASNQHKVALHSRAVDYIINGPGDMAFPALLDALEENQGVENIPNLIYLKGEEIITTKKDALLDQDVLPQLPYDKLFSVYPSTRYLRNTFLGTKTAAYHSSFGCPFTCSFCAVVPIYNARWKGKSAENIFQDVKFLKDQHGANAIEFHDNNFFVNEKRVVAFSKLMMNEGMNWWGEGRIDTIDKYSDESLELMRKSGCRMIFLGAETGNDDILSQMNKGGTQTGEQIKAFAARMLKFDIIPEYSFVLGMPAETPEKVMEQIDKDIAFIREIKNINPHTEVIIYIYSPVPTEGSELYDAVQKAGFKFPETLEDWLSPEWENFDLRKNPLTPWLTPPMIDKIKNFETVLHGYYPSVANYRLSNFQKKTIQSLAGFRYNLNLMKYPLEVKFLQKFWLKYTFSEIEGFATE